MVVFSSLDLYFTLLKCKLQNRKPRQLNFMMFLTIVTRKISFQLLISIFLYFHREEIQIRDGKWKMNLKKVSFHLTQNL